MTKAKRLFLFMLLLGASIYEASAQAISGKVADQKTKEPLIGAVVSVEGTDKKTVSDVDGRFRIEGLKQSTYTLLIEYVGYKTKKN
jgi:hypothetical protein